MPKKYPPHKCENPECKNITTNKRACSKKCAQIIHSERMRGENNPKYVEKILKVCAACGKHFEVYPAWERKARKEGVKYCSRKCADKGRSANLIRICRTCGKSFKVYPSTIKKGGHNGGDSGVYCSKKCADEGIRGERCYLWKGGISFGKYCKKFNNEFKERVRAFFGYQCAECGTTQESDGRLLSVHHVHYNKRTCCDNSDRLFVPLCKACHTRTNHKRKYWQTHFTELINTKYGGKCYYTKEEWAALNGELLPTTPRRICTDPQPAAARSH